MTIAPKQRRIRSADKIAQRVDNGEDVSAFFTNRGTMVQPIHRVNVFSVTMLAELDKASQQLDVSQQAIIKTLLRQALDQHYLAETAALSLANKKALKKKSSDCAPQAIVQNDGLGHQQESGFQLS